MNLSEAYHVYSKQQDLDELRNDGALAFFRIMCAIEDTFKAEFKAVAKAQKENNTKELERLSGIEKDIEFEPLTEQHLKDSDLLTAQILRDFRPIMNVSRESAKPKPEQKSD